MMEMRAAAAAAAAAAGGVKAQKNYYKNTKAHSLATCDRAGNSGRIVARCGSLSSCLLVFGILILDVCY